VMMLRSINRGVSGERRLFFRSSRYESLADEPRVIDLTDAGSEEMALRRTQRLMEWRLSAQRVTHAWNAWLAAESRDGGLRYSAFVAAVAREEGAAAALQRTIDLGSAKHRDTRIDADNGGCGAQ
jgi:hypothetical protein